MSKVVPFDEIDNFQVYDIECDDGVPEVIELSGVPREIAAKLQRSNGWRIAPEELKSFVTVSIYSPKRGDESDNPSSLRIVFDFIPRKFACLKLIRSVIRVMIGETELRLRLKCRKCDRPENAHYTRAMLAIDLGNTRTCALVCPDIDVGIRNLKLKKLELSPHYAKSGCSGVWDSLCVIGKSRNYKSTSPSFVRLGVDNDLYLRDGNVFSENLRSLSTPKRYFWDIDSDRNWCVIYPEDSDEYLLKDQRDIELVDHISREHYRGRHPRAMILEGMIFEMLEQAERMLNGENRFLTDRETRDQVRPQKRTYIAKLAITYPAAWSPKEVEMYRGVIQRGIDCYVSQRCGNIPPVELPSACNEAVAVMVNYIYSETLRFGEGCRWLRLCGKLKSLGDNDVCTLRIGVIDIGGGTSDLAVTQVTLNLSDNALNISTLYTAGTNEAGDAMMALIIRDIIFDKVFARLFPNLEGPKRDKMKVFFGREVAPKLKSLTRAFWFPLAIKFLEGIGNADSDNFAITLWAPKAEDALSRGFRTLRAALDDKTGHADDEEISKLGHYLMHFDNEPAAGDDGPGMKSDGKIAIAFDRRDIEKFQEVLKKNFSSSPKIFGSAIAAYNCDLMIWSGKTADNPTIRKLFEDQMPVPPEASVSMNDYRISGDRFPLTDLAGRLSDSKLATCVGAELYQLLQNDPDLKIIAGENDKRQLLWGRKNAAGLFKPLFRADGQGDSDSLEYNGTTPLIICRADSDSPYTFPLPAYEFRSKPGLNITNVSVLLRLKKGDHGTLDFEPMSGEYSKDGDRKEFNAHGKEDFELHIRMTDEDEIWLDSGNII